MSNKTTQSQVGLIGSIIAHTGDKGIKMVDVFTATQMDKGTMNTYLKLHKYSEPTWNKKSISKNPRIKRCIAKTEMYEEQKKDESMTITFLKINIFTFPQYQIKNRFQICRKRQRGDPRRHPKPKPAQANSVCVPSS